MGSHPRVSSAEFQATKCLKSQQAGWQLHTQSFPYIVSICQFIGRKQAVENFFDNRILGSVYNCLLVRFFLLTLPLGQLLSKAFILYPFAFSIISCLLFQLGSSSLLSIFITFPFIPPYLFSISCSFLFSHCIFFLPPLISSPPAALFFFTAFTSSSLLGTCPHPLLFSLRVLYITFEPIYSNSNMGFKVIEIFKEWLSGRSHGN